MLVLSQLARHRPLDVGPAGAGVRREVPRAQVRPPRPRRVCGDAGPVHHRTAGARRPRAPRYPGDGPRPLLRPVDGRDGRDVARRRIPATGSRSWCYATPPRRSDRRTRGTPGSRPCGKAGWRRSSPACSRAGLRRGSCSSRPRCAGRFSTACARRCSRISPRRLRRVLRGRPGHGPAGDDRAHRYADPGDRRNARRGHAAGGRHNSSPSRSAARSTSSSTPRIFPTSRPADRFTEAVLRFVAD